MEEHKNLQVWKKSMDLAVKAYTITKCFPKEEMPGLTGRIWKAAVAIPSNIAEGSERRSDREFIRFLHAVLGASAELETLFLISARLKCLEKEEGLFDELVVVRKMLISLVKSIQKKNKPDAG